MTVLADLIAQARTWLAHDPDPETRAATELLIREGDQAALAAAFSERLEFGTAGIRGAMGPGPGRMNRALVRRVTAGLGAYLLEQHSEVDQVSVVVGFDGRHRSHIFATETAQVLAGMGIKVWLHEVVVPTPVLAHSLTFLDAQGGVMVTASHNPPADNGYKVYWDNGAQIIEPHDEGISAAIDRVDPASIDELVPLAQLMDQGLIAQVPPSAGADYVHRVLALRVHRITGIRATYSAMHGVGWATLDRVLRTAGHVIEAVPAQRDPDGDFPTVAFPNPEEPGALDLAKAQATASGSELIVAHDPDADRLAVAVPDGAGWRQLTGNEVGLLLADDLLAHGPQVPDRLVANSIVSSSLLARVAELHGALSVETLTGFKWIANAAIAHDGPFVLGFEEALGYSAGDVVRDKDGVSAALLILDLASRCKARGTTLDAHLTELYRRVGYAASHQHSLKLPGADGKARIDAIMTRLRENPPASLGGLRVHTVRDLEARQARDTATGSLRPLDLPASNVLAFDLEEGCRVLARPSGTEPKLKFYFEVHATLGEGEALAEAAARAQARVEVLLDEVLTLAGVR